MFLTEPSGVQTTSGSTRREVVSMGDLITTSVVVKAFVLKGGRVKEWLAAIETGLNTGTKWQR